MKKKEKLINEKKKHYYKLQWQWMKWQNCIKI